MEGGGISFGACSRHRPDGWNDAGHYPMAAPAALKSGGLTPFPFLRFFFDFRVFCVGRRVEFVPPNERRDQVGSATAE